MKTLPHDLEAEASVLGAMLQSERAITEASRTLSVGDFYEARHRHIFEAVLALFGKGRAADPVTVVDELRTRKLLDKVGGPLYIAELAANVPMPGSAGQYARIVSESAVRRALIDAAQTIEQAATEGEDVNELVEKAEEAVFRAGRRREMDQATLAEDAVFEALKHLQSDEHAGAPTGFRDLDRHLGGLRPGKLYVIAARPGVGKSALVTNIARNFALSSAERAVAMWSLEMSDIEIGERLLSRESRIALETLRDRSANDSENRALGKGADAFEGAAYWILDNATSTLVDIRGNARRFQAGRGLDLVIVDYLQLMGMHDGSRAKNREQEIAEISRGLKVLAKELSIPVIAVSQLNRDSERRSGKRPQLSDLRESGSIEQDADVVIFLHRDEESAPGIVDVMVAKNRAGKTTVVKLHFDARTTTFHDLEDR